MRYLALPAFEKQVKEAAPDHLSPVYLVVESEGEEVLEAAKALIKALFPKEADRGLGVHRLEGEEVTGNDLGTLWTSPPFLTSRRLIWVRQAEFLKKSLVLFLEQECIHRHPSCFLLLSASSLPKQSSLYKWAEKEGIVLDISPKKPWEKNKELLHWLLNQALLVKKSLPAFLAGQLVRWSGGNLAVLKQEWQKILLYVGDKKEIEPLDLAAVAVDASVDTPWEMGEAVFRGDMETALLVGRRLLQEAQGVFPLLRQLRGQLESQYQILVFSEMGREDEIVTHFPYLRGSLLTKRLQMARQYGKKRLQKGMLLLDQGEARLKNAEVEEFLLWDLLLMQLCDQ